ncbi:uncharacterized protein PAC_15187 [Phialocephala subalpina]|uniref:C2H2-type domain-containing protein n=1 Tax=Phialocephala subalpina TaxID=576137 RepID=A0A1L7XK11_9HELO|nr:uncharacterized protein PAC_15187 [Phialocephala subalpina]
MGPFQCTWETCNKSSTLSRHRRDIHNVQVHKIVHSQSGPYLCRLDNCSKQFTRRDNLKSHQKQSHIDTIRASIKDEDIIHATDKELWEYFANLYKNSNKAIKGRGNDGKVGSNPMALKSSMHNLGVYGRGGDGQQYEMFDVDKQGSQSQCENHSGSGGGSSVGTCYDDAPSDGFEDPGRGNGLAFCAVQYSDAFTPHSGSEKAEPLSQYYLKSGQEDPMQGYNDGDSDQFCTSTLWEEDRNVSVNTEDGIGGIHTIWTVHSLCIRIQSRRILGIKTEGYCLF